jgi:hypothetical protein
MRLAKGARGAGRPDRRPLYRKVQSGRPVGGVVSARLSKTAVGPAEDDTRAAGSCLFFASLLSRGLGAAPPVTNEKGDSSNAEQQHRNRSEVLGLEVCEISERVFGRIDGIVEDGYLLSDVGFFLLWALPPTVGFTICRKPVAVPVVIRRFVGGDRTLCDLLPLGDCSVDGPLVDGQGYAYAPRHNNQ